MPTCRLDARGQPVCTSCPLGSEGDRCDRCAVGYDGTPPTGCRPAAATAPIVPAPTGQCPAGHLRCPSNGRCIPAAARCDGRADCAQGEDEQGCEQQAAGIRAGVQCDPRGALSARPSASTGLCECKVSLVEA